jgi:glycosyltransferase involved in cell wall biosynthesis
MIWKLFWMLDTRLALFLLRGLAILSKQAKRLQTRFESIVDGLHGEQVPDVQGKVVVGGYNGRVAFLCHSLGFYHPAGYAARSNSILRSLKALGVAVSAVVRPGYPWDLKDSHHLERRRSVDHRGTSFTLFPESSVTLADSESTYIEGYAQYAARFVQDTGSSLIHASSNYLNGSAAALAGQRLGVPAIYEMRGLWHVTRAFNFPSYRGSDHYRCCEKREIEACRGVDHVITLSDALKGWLVARGVPGDKVTVVGNAAPEQGPVPEGQVPALRRYHELGDARPVVGYMGSLVEYEGLDRLITLLAATAAGRRPWLLVAGDGKAREALVKQARKMGVEGDVIFAGRVAPEQVAAYYSLFDAAALPRRDSELTRLVPPIKPFEIVAHGCPLLVSEPVEAALGTTLSEGYTAVDFDALADMEELLERAAEVPAAPLSVPTWNDRAAEVISVYRLFEKEPGH